MTRRVFVAHPAAIAVAGRSAAGPAAPPRRDLLAGAWPAAKLASTLLPADRWKPYPAASDRASWEALPAEVRKSAAESGARALGETWPALPATLFLEFARNGNRSRYEAEWNKRRGRVRALVLAECVEANGRYLDEIANGVWTICEETFWGFPAHLNLQKRRGGLPDVTEPVIDLFAAETGALLAWTEYLVGPLLERVSPLVRERIRVETERRILEPYRTREDWGWMGLAHTNPVNNWNPWINSNCLTCALAFERDPQRRAAFVHKILRSLDRFLDSYFDDGGCDEGPSYWGHAGGSLFDNLELLRSASGGAIDIYSAPLVREIGRYIYRVHIHDNWYVNFADASARVDIPGDLVFRYGRRIGDEKMQALGAWAGKRRPPLEAGSIGRVLPALFDQDIHTATTGQPYTRDAWMPGIQVMTARYKEGSAEGLYLAAQGGHNGESHNHNDVGNFVVYSNGLPAIIDIGVETYSAKTFSPQRYEIWTMQSAYHNLPTVNGVMQSPGRTFAAGDVSYSAGGEVTELKLDIAGAYPPEAGIALWVRTLRLDRANNRVEVTDRYKLQKAGGRVEFTLMSPCEAEIGPGRIRLADRAVVSVDGRLTATVERIAIKDARLAPVWGEQLYRVLLKADGVPAAGEFALEITPAASR